MNKIIVGLTGGIACGKTYASEKLVALGCAVTDADIISREISAPGTFGEKAIAAAFADVVLNGAVDRTKLREKVFNDESALKKLNEITHPLIESRFLQLIRNSEKNIVIAVVPLLFESGFDKFADLTVTVSCPEVLRIQRLVKRDNISEELARKILNAQLTDAEREKKANFVLNNAGSLEDFDKEIYGLFLRLKAEAEKISIKKLKK